MDLPQELENIEVDTPPPSPVSFVEDSFDSFDTQDVASPVKRPRKTGGFNQSKRPKKVHAQIVEQSSPEIFTDFYDSGSELHPIDDEAPARGYMGYVAGVAEGLARFYPLSSELFVVQGWDEKLNSAKNTWYHLQHVVAGDEVHTACVCPQGRGAVPCVHEQYIREYHKQILEEGPSLPAGYDEKGIRLWARQRGEGDTYENWMSVIGRQLGSHTIVIFHGEDTGVGSWTCTKDRESTCQHILQAQRELQDTLEMDGGHIEEWHGLYPAKDDKRTGVMDAAISHRPILPPIWCSMPNDPHLYDRPRPIEEDPPVLLLDSDSRCTCKAEFDPALPISRIPCVIYGLSKTTVTEIEIQHCQSCDPRRRQSIGPDLRERGLFNWSNQILFTHDLLDEYTSAYSTSETPFAAWILVVRNRYQTYSSRHPFVSVGLFRSAWFAFVRLQNFVNDMACAICGPTPENVIWDGVTVSFSKKKLLPSLQPPTTTSKNSPSRGNVQYYPNQQLIPDRDTRQLILNALISHERIVKQPGNSGPATGAVEWDTITEGHEDDDADVLRRAEERLREVNTGLGTVFAKRLGSESGSTKPAPAYLELFQQVASDDTVLRLGTTDDMAMLDAFLHDPIARNASRLISIPALYQVLKSEVSKEGTYPKPILEVMGWIRNRARSVLKVLLSRGADLGVVSDIGGGDWKQTGACYSLPQIRYRPLYPKLKHEQESNNRGGKCSKYYNEYSKNRLTGGIMAVWCTHVVCYGFHCIPRSEGRNDVFSAMVTRWPQAPKRVIYDFACSLGPYCMLREPAFFANTKFIIDNFHTSNHTKCDRAWFLSSYSAVYPQLAKVNSSAAECGNSGLHRIRKSISYMSQDRAVLYIKVFLSVWNRKKLTRMQASNEVVRA